MGEGTENRHFRRAFKSIARRHQEDLVLISQLACKHFKEEPEITKRWLYQETAELEDCSPIEFILLGRGKEVIALLEKAKNEKN